MMGLNLDQTEPPLLGRRWGISALVGFFLLILILSVSEILATANNQGSFRTVTLVESGQVRSIPTTALTVGDFLEKLAVTVSVGDIVKPNPDSRLVGDHPVISLKRARPVRIVDGQSQRMVTTALESPEAIVVASGRDLKANEQAVWVDDIEAIDKDLILAQTIHIISAQTYRLDYDGPTPIDIVSAGPTVREVLADNNIYIGVDDQTYPGADEYISAGAKITLARQPNRIKTKLQTTTLKKVSRGVTSLKFGQRQLVDAGQPRRSEMVYLVGYDDAGVETDSRLIDQHIIDPGQAPVEHYGLRTKTTVNTTIPTGERSGLMAAAGISRSDQVYASRIVMRESSWRPQASNPRSTAYGLCQALQKDPKRGQPGDKMKSHGSDWRTNPVTQMRWCDWYAHDRYGGWAAAWEFWRLNKWW